MLCRRMFLGLALAAVWPPFMACQGLDLRDLIPALVTSSLYLDPSLGNGVNHSLDFLLSTGLETRDAQLALQAFNQLLASQLSSLPFPSPSGGFTYKYEPGVGFIRNSESFGPIYADRAETIGKGRLDLAVGYSHSSFDRLDGLKLDPGDVLIITPHRDVNGDGELLHPYYEGDVMGTNLSLKVSSDVTAFILNYGLSDRLDVGAVIPIARVQIDALIASTIDRLSTSADPTIHRFPPGTPLRFDTPAITTGTFQMSGSASGLGDIALRTKFHALESSNWGFAVACDIWFPSGNERDLLGTGATRIRPSLIGSLRLGLFSPHLNVGYTWASTPPSDRLSPAPALKIPDEISYTGGFDLVLGPRVTFAADVLGRTLRKTQILSMTDRTFTANTNPDDTKPPVLVQATLRTLTVHEGDVTTLLGSAGVKINPLGNLLVTVNALFALDRRHGLESAVTPFVGLDYSF